jgi:hypothetical protein
MAAGPYFRLIRPSKEQCVFIAEVILWACAAYLAVGLAIGTAFIWRGVDHVDAAAAGTTWAFRLVILPGAVALWPVIIRLWLRDPKDS